MSSSNHCHGPIHAADDAAQQLLFAARIAADDLQGLRLKLKTLLCKPAHNVPSGRDAAANAPARYLLHRKEYKSLPTDKSG
jgi:hypothetical protein